MEMGIKVLSLFDGMSCGQQALNNLGIDIDIYLSSEIDKYAIQVTQHNFPNTIQVGDITKIKGEDYKNIDLIMGGSPCQGFSFAGKQLAFDDPRSKLFFEYVRILKEVKPKYFLLENVKMKKEFQDVISEYLYGIQPIVINSSLLTAQNRVRLYWVGELQEDGTYKQVKIEQPEDRGILLKDILEENVDYKYVLSEKASNRALFNKRSRAFSNETNKTPTLLSNQYKQSTDALYLIDLPIVRKLTPIECERLQGVKDNYTSCVSNSQRYKMLGNGWTVDVIAHIFTFLNL